MTWWLIGDLSSPGFAPDELDYMFRAPEAFDRHATAAGVVGLVVAAACLVVLGWLYRADPRRGLMHAAVAVGLGFWIGLAGRTFTAGGIGANIGGGLVFMATIGGIVSLVAYQRSKRTTF